VISPSQRSLSDNTQQSQETDIHVPTGIRTQIPASEQPQTHALDRAAPGIDKKTQIQCKKDDDDNNNNNKIGINFNTFWNLHGRTE
jgi:hypothetical protein